MMVKPVTNETIEEAVQILQSGGIVVFATETAYGIGCDATNDKAVQQLIATKQRRVDKGLPVIIENLEQAKQEIVLVGRALELAETHWPGPLNIIGRKQENGLISALAAKNGKQAIRVSSGSVSSTLVRLLGKPIVATSANVSGQPTTYDPSEIEKQFQDQALQPNLILSSGMIPENPPSTIIEAMGEQVQVLRFGNITIR